MSFYKGNPTENDILRKSIILHGVPENDVWRIDCRPTKKCVRICLLNLGRKLSNIE